MVARRSAVVCGAFLSILAAACSGPNQKTPTPPATSPGGEAALEVLPHRCLDAPAPGVTFTESTKVNFGVVKDIESCP
jgi:hypothetical protein